MTPEQQAAMLEYQNAVRDYLTNGAEQYDWLGDLSYEDLGELERLAPSAYEDIVTNPEFDQYEIEALRALEEQSKDGFSLRDEAALAKLQSAENRRLRGQRGAIQQNMASRGISGSGLDFIAQQQAAQDSAELEALRGLEQAAMSQERRQSASARLGQLGSNLKQNDFARQARLADARDSIARFNTQNSNARAEYNNRLRNDARSQNWSGRQDISNRNTDERSRFNDKALSARTGKATTDYNAATEDYNRRQLEEAERRRRRKEMTGMITGIAGAGIGAAYGGPEGASAGGNIGSTLGQAFGAHGGRVSDDSGLDSYDNDTKLMFVSPGEVIVPRSKADDPFEAAQFVAEINGDGMMGTVEARNQPDNDDVVSALLGVIESMNRRRR